MRAQRPCLLEEEAKADERRNDDCDWSFPHVTDMQAATNQVHSGLTIDEDAIPTPQNQNQSTNIRGCKDLGYCVLDKYNSFFIVFLFT